MSREGCQPALLNPWAGRNAEAINCNRAPCAILRPVLIFIDNPGAVLLYFQSLPGSIFPSARIRVWTLVALQEPRVHLVASEQLRSTARSQTLNDQMELPSELGRYFRSILSGESRVPHSPVCRNAASRSACLRVSPACILYVDGVYLTAGYCHLRLLGED